MRVGTLAVLIPDQWLPIILMGAGLAWILGARKVAGAMAIFAVLSLILPPLLAPMIQTIPRWLLWVLLIYLGLMIPFAAISVLQALVTPALGNRTASEAAGRWAADVGRIIFTAPFKLISAFSRLIAKLDRKKS